MTRRIYLQFLTIGIFLFKYSTSKIYWKYCALFLFCSVSNSSTVSSLSSSNSTISPSSNSYTVEASVPSADATEPPAELASTHAPTTVEVHTFTTTQSNAFFIYLFLFLFPFDYLFCFSVDHIVFRCSFIVHSIRPSSFAVYNIPTFLYKSFS
jgi:hypothetical protein